MSHPTASPSATTALTPASLPAGFTEATAEVNGVRIHYVRGGTGEPLVLLHGWPQTWYA
ncbi:MAG: alpha/beta fold hydrolase [Janthinobacterium lividum]